MKFLHAADIHLDSPLLGLAEYDGAPVDDIRNATRQALEAIVDLAIAEEVDFVLIAGDVYDGSWRDYNTGLFFVNQLSRLSKEETPVFLIAGNHDAASVITKELSLPRGCVKFGSKKPETVQLAEIEVAIHGQSFESKAVFDNLAASYPDPIPGFFNKTRTSTFKTSHIETIVTNKNPIPKPSTKLKETHLDTQPRW